MTAAGNNSPVICVVGATASGKSALALRLAAALSGEIVSADSMQVYRGMDIGVAKPTAEERRNVTHHLIDVLDISEPLDVYWYVEKADEAIAAIRARGKVPIVVGGSGLYVRALVQGLDPLPTDAATRRELERRFAGDDGPARLASEVTRLDPAAWAMFGNHPRRLLRALEVLTLTGRSITAFREAWSRGAARYPALIYRLDWPRAELFARVERRIDQMFAEGWVEETKRLLANGLMVSPTARQAIGYREIVAWLNGQGTYERTRADILSATKKYSRRQETWFRRQCPDAVPVLMPGDGDRTVETIVGAVRQSAADEKEMLPC